VFAVADLQLLQEAMPESVHSTGLDFLWSGERYTSLRQLLRQRFALPVPLQVSLTTATQAWGPAQAPGGDGERANTPDIGPYRLPDFHADAADRNGPSVAPDDTALLQDTLAPDQVHQLQEAMQTHLVLLQQLWRSCTVVVRSDWQQQH